MSETLSSDATLISQELEQIVANGKVEVPLLPDVASRVLALSNDPDSDAAQLAKLIQGDQALAGHVMRIANSAAYSPNASLVSLQQAIARLGMALITEIALAASVNTKMFKAPGYEKRIADIWSHALCSAIWGKEISRAAKKNVEASFLCGLLHSIGRPVVLQAVADISAKQGIQLSVVEALDLERQHHVAFGEVIVRKWEMPTIVQETVKHYLKYESTNDDQEQAMVINCASQMAFVTLWPENHQMNEVVESGVFADLNLYQDEVEVLLDKEDVVKSALEAMRV